MGTVWLTKPGKMMLSYHELLYHLDIDRRQLQINLVTRPMGQ